VSNIQDKLASQCLIIFFNLVLFTGEFMNVVEIGGRIAICIIDLRGDGCPCSEILMVLKLTSLFQVALPQYG